MKSRCPPCGPFSFWGQGNTHPHLWKACTGDKTAEKHGVLRPLKKQAAPQKFVLKTIDR